MARGCAGIRAYYRASWGAASGISRSIPSACTRRCCTSDWLEGTVVTRGAAPGLAPGNTRSKSGACEAPRLPSDARRVASTHVAAARVGDRTPRTGRLRAGGVRPSASPQCGCRSSISGHVHGERRARPARVPPESERVLPLALALTSHRLGEVAQGSPARTSAATSFGSRCS